MDTKKPQRPASTKRPTSRAPVKRGAAAPRSALAEANKPQGPVRQPKATPLLDAICKKLNQRVNREDEQRVLGIYERGWIFRGVLATLDGDEARYVRALATRHNSWLARQIN